MTDEEKAEEILQTKGSMTFCAKGCGYTEKVIELIALGIAEGRKEKCFEQNNDGTIRPCEVMKENEELKKYIHRCWQEEEINDYSNYVTNTDSEFKELVNRLRSGSL